MMKKTLLCTLLVLGMSIALFGFLLSIFNGLVTLLVNVFYFILFIFVLFVLKKTKKSNKLFTGVSIGTLVLTFGIKGLSDLLAYWNTPKYLVITYKWALILTHIPSIYIMFGLIICICSYFWYTKKIIQTNTKSIGSPKAK